MGQSGVLIATSPHPVHDGFLLAVWIVDGQMSFDCLLPQQEFQIERPQQGSFKADWQDAITRFRGSSR
jgi:hypothetical protein